MKRFSIIAGFVAGIALVGAGFFVAPVVRAQTADDVSSLNREIEARKAKIKQLEETIAKYNKEISTRQAEASSLKNQLRILDVREDEINADIELTKEKILQTELEIQSLQVSIGDKNSSIGKQKKIVAQMVKQIHDGDQKNYLEIMMTYGNFSDFYNELKAAEDVYVDLGRSVKTLRLAREDLESRKEQVELKQRTLKELKAKLDNRRSDLNNQIGAKQNLLTQTKSQEAKYQTLVGNLKAQYQAIEGEVRSYEDQLRKRLASQDRSLPTGSVDFAWPVPSHYINAYFHDPDYPYRSSFEHSGIDIRASQGTAVRASASGYVGKARRCSLASCYAYVLLVHTNEISTLYGHLSQILVADDQYVHQGDIIGYSGGKPGTVGAGPFVTGAHLHFEVRLRGIPVNPLGYVTP